MFCEIEGFMNGQQFKKLYEKQYEPLMKKYEMKKIELDVMFFLYTYKRYDTAKDIVNYKCLSKAHVSKAIENLINKDYIVARSDEKDRRCVHLSVTQQAAPIMCEMEQLWKEVDLMVYHDVTEEERLLLVEVIKKVVNNINSIMDMR